jgi:hypothetical protein
MVESTTVSKNNNNKSDNRSNTTQQQQELQTQTFSWTRNNTLFLENSYLWILVVSNAKYLP